MPDACARLHLSAAGGVRRGRLCAARWSGLRHPCVVQAKLPLLAEARAAGIRAIEAPVTGGVHLAKSGEITVICGGPEEAVQRIDDAASAHLKALA